MKPHQVNAFEDLRSISVNIVAMKALVRKLFAPLFTRLEAGDEAYVYRRSSRVILYVVSLLFLFLASLSLVLATSIDYLFPTLVFGVAGLFGLLIAWAGEDIAVARIWGSRK